MEQDNRTQSDADDKLDIVLRDYTESTSESATEAANPMEASDGYARVGNPADDSFFVLMAADVHAFIREFAQTDTSRELGGVLVGTLLEGDRTIIWVDAAIEARYTEAVKTSVKFTHKSWEYMNQVKDKKFPEKRIVGWWHTHPVFRDIPVEF